MKRNALLIRSAAVALLGAGLLASAGCGRNDSVKISSTRTEDVESGVLKVVDALQCPQTQGDLTRKGTAQAGGTVCTYVGPRGTQVTLHLVPLNGQTPETVLKSFENALSSDMPEAMDQLARGQAEAARADAEAARADAEAARADAEAARADAENVSVQAPGMDIQASGNDKASVRLPGVRIEADGDKASVNLGGIHINANDANSTVSIKGDVNNEAVDIQGNDNAGRVRVTSSRGGTRVRWMVTNNRPNDDGWRVVGYEARGPVGGPIVVATVRSRDRNNDDAFSDAEDLVGLNVGE